MRMVSSVTEEQGSHKTDLAHEKFDHEDADPDASRLIKWKARGQPPAQALAQVTLSNLKQLMPSITMPHRSTFPFGFANNKGAFTAQNTLYPTTVTGLQSFFTIYHSLKCVKKRERGGSRRSLGNGVTWLALSAASCKYVTVQYIGIRKGCVLYA